MMHASAIFSAAAVLAALPTLFAADNLLVGTWKQNLSISKYSPGPAPIAPATLRFESVPGGGEKLSRAGTDGQGNPSSWGYTATYDGKPVLLAGSPYGNRVALKRMDARTTEITYTRDGTVTRTARRVISADGKTLTITASGTDENGQKYENVVVYEKQ